MSNTPHMSLRVKPEQLERWKEACRDNGIDLSFQIRRLMDAWAKVEAAKKEAAFEDLAQQRRLVEQAGKLLDEIHS